MGEMTSARVISARRRSPPDSVYAGDDAERRQVELGEQFLAARAAPRRVEIERLEDGHDVLLDGESAEDRRLLRQVSDALAGPRVHGAIGDILAIEDDTPGIGRRQSYRHVERRRFAGAVGSEQADHFSRLHIEADAADNRTSAVGFRELFRAKGRHSAFRRWRAGVVGRSLRPGIVSAFEQETISASGEGQRTAVAAPAGSVFRALEHPHQLAFADDVVLLLWLHRR